MPGPGRDPAAGQGHVDGLGDQHLLVTFGLEPGLALLDRVAYLGAGRAHPPSGVGAFGRRQRADAGAGQGERRAVTVVREPRRLQLVQGPGGGDGHQGLVEGPGYLFGGQGDRLVILVLCGHEGPASCGPYQTLALLGFRRIFVPNERWWQPTSTAERRGDSSAWGVSARHRCVDSPKGHYRTGPWCVAAGRRGQPAAVPAGTINRNSAPPPGARRTPIVPPCASTRPLTI